MLTITKNRINQNSKKPIKQISYIQNVNTNDLLQLQSKSESEFNFNNLLK